MKTDVQQSNFTGGELAPALFGRTDIAQYVNACAIVENFLVRPHSSLISCPGTEFINDAKYTSGASTANTLALYVPFSTDFSDESPYNHIPSSSVVTLSTATFATSPASGHFPNTSSSILIYSYHSIFELDDNNFEIGVRFRISNQLVHGDSRTIISKGRPHVGASDFGGFSIFIGTENFGENDRLQAVVGGFGNYYGCDYTMPASTKFQANTWYKVMTNRISNTMYLYLDDVLVATADLTGVIVPEDNVPVVIGGQINSSESGYEARINGYVDEAYIINGISPAEYPTTRVYGRSRLIPFVFSRDDAYAIECGESYFRFYTNGGVVNA